MSLHEKLEIFFEKLIPYDRPAALTLAGWDQWKKETQKNYPIAYFIFEIIPEKFNNQIIFRWKRWITDPYYNFSVRFFRKYHHIKIDVVRFFEPYNKKKNSKYHWLDSDIKILYGMFQVLVDYIEKEEPGEIIDWTYSPDHEHVWNELQFLYKWWIEDRPKREIENPAPTMEDFGASFLELGSGKKQSPGYKKWSEACEEYRKLESQWDNEDTEMLIRLITIRRYMWT